MHNYPQYADLWGFSSVSTFVLSAEHPQELNLSVWSVGLTDSYLLKRSKSARALPVPVPILGTTF